MTDTIYRFYNAETKQSLSDRATGEARPAVIGVRGYSHNRGLQAVINIRNKMVQNYNLFGTDNFHFTGQGNETSTGEIAKQIYAEYNRLEALATGSAEAMQNLDLDFMFADKERLSMDELDAMFYEVDVV